MKSSASWAYNVDFDVKIAIFAAEKISEIGDKDTLRKIKREVIGLSDNPLIQGKPLGGKCAGYRRLRFSRYRIIYKVISSRKLVAIAYVGIEREGDRADVYREFKALLDSTEPEWYLDKGYFIE